MVNATGGEGVCVDAATLQRLADRLNAKLSAYAQARVQDVGRGLESAALGGLIVQKYATGMAEAIAVLEDLLDVRLPTPLAMDAATSLVDPAWRENMRARFSAKADLDLSQPRPGSDR